MAIENKTINPHRFILGRMVDVVLANELHASFRIALVDADGARRQRLAQRVRLGIPEFEVDLDRVFEGRSGLLRISVIVGLPVNLKMFLQVDSG